MIPPRYWYDSFKENTLSLYQHENGNYSYHLSFTNSKKSYSAVDTSYESVINIINSERENILSLNLELFGEKNENNKEIRKLFFSLKRSKRKFTNKKNQAIARRLEELAQ